MGKRVQVPTYSDAWMRGDRYGEVIGYLKRRVNDSAVARVRLDKSGRVETFLIDDCREV